MKEIGGYIEFERFTGEAYHKDCLALNSARNGLRYIIQKLGIKRIFLPKLDCSSVTDACEKENVEMVLYSVDEEFHPITEGIDSREWLYVINFYGQLDQNYLEELHKKYQKMIVDNVPAFFDLPLPGVDTVYSCRKFFGVPDGAYLYMDTAFDLAIPHDKSSSRVNYLVGRLEDTALEHYGEYHENEAYLDDADVMKMSAFTDNMMHGINYQRNLEIRRKNFKVLADSLDKVNELNVKVPFGPFAYPLLIKNGASVRKKLQQEKIYIPTLWPNVLVDCNPAELEYRLAADLLPIPLDQRYNEEDMKYLVQEVLKCINSEN